jgi:hypothetical protein
MYQMSSGDAGHLADLARVLETFELRLAARSRTPLRELVRALCRLPQVTPGIDIEIGISTARRWGSLGINETELSLRAGNITRLEDGRRNHDALDWCFLVGALAEKKGDFHAHALVPLARALPARLSILIDGGVRARRRDVTRAMRARLGTALHPLVERIVYWQSATACRFEIFTRGTNLPVGFLSRDLSLFAGVAPAHSFAENLRALTAGVTASDYRKTGVCELFEPVVALLP